MSNTVRFPFIFLWLISLPHLFVVAQSNPLAWGKVSEKERQLSLCPFDSTAPAVILSESGSLTFDSQGKAYLYVYRRIKILSANGFEHANIKLPYFTHNGLESINSIKAQTININANRRLKKIKVKGEEIFNVKLDDKWSERRFTFPDVQVGSIVEYSYVQPTKNLAFLEGWAFQKTIPVLLSEFKANLINTLDYKILYQGKKIIEKYGEGEHNHWILENLPGIKEEPYSLNSKDYIEKIRFQLAGYVNISSADGSRNYISMMHTWESLAEELLHHSTFSQYLNRHSKAKYLLESLIKKEEDSSLKAFKIYNYLRKDMRWNGNFSIIPLKTASDLISSKLGNTADLNLLLTLLLREAGLNALPLLISTLGNGKIIKDYPFINQFNMLICYLNIDGEEYFLDVTNKLRPFGLLPKEALVQEGFLLDEQEPRWISIAPPRLSETKIKGKVLFQGPNGKYTFSNEYTGYSALSKRNQLQENNEAIIIENVIDQKGNNSLDSIKIYNVKEVDHPLQIHFDLLQEIQLSGGFIYFSPVIPEDMNKNPFTAEKRIFPIDLDFTFNNQVELQIYIPQGYRVYKLPRNLKLKMPYNYGEFNYSIVEQEGLLLMTLKTSINTLTIPVEEYRNLKRFFDTKLARMKEPIIFIKI